MKETKRKKQLTKVMILVLSLVVLAFSGTYAYYTNHFIGNPNTTSATSGVFKIESSLDKVSAINNKRLILIDEEEKTEKAEKLTFTITNTEKSTIDGKFDVYLKDIRLSKNLYSSYLKWELVKDGEIINQGDFSTVERKDEESSTEDEKVVTLVEDVKLTTNSLSLLKNTTETLTFRVYLLNDENKNQIELTEGSFSGRLYIEAIPVKNVTK